MKNEYIVKFTHICISTFCLLIASGNLYAQLPINNYRWVDPPPASAFVGDVFYVSAYVSCSWNMDDVSLRNYATWITNPLCSHVNVTGSNWLKKITVKRAGSAPFNIDGLCAGTAHHDISCTSAPITVFALTQKLASVVINAPTNIFLPASTQLTFTAIFAASNTEVGHQANWSVSPTSLAKITSSGLLSLSNASVISTVSVSVSYAYLTISKASTNIITITPTTTNTPVPVPYCWIDDYPTLLSSHGGDYGETANSMGLNGCFVWESYVAGLVPTDSESRLKTYIGYFNGNPVITWDPDLGAQRIYTIISKSNLLNSQWLATNAASKFFRVKVRVP